MDHLPTPRNILIYSGLFCAIFGYFKIFIISQDISRYFWLSWALQGFIELSWTILAILSNLGPFLANSGYIWLSLAISAYLNLSIAIYSYLWLYVDISCYLNGVSSIRVQVETGQKQVIAIWNFFISVFVQFLSNSKNAEERPLSPPPHGR